jgi:O-antigen ligase
LFVATIAVSYSYTSAPDYGATKLFRLAGIGGLLLLAPLFLIRDEDEFRNFMRIFLLFAGVMVLQLVSGVQAPSAHGDVTRIGAGWIVGMAAVIVLFYPVFKSESQQRLFLLFAMPIYVIGLMASVARGPMVALFLILMIRVVYWFQEGKRTLALTLVAIFALSGTGAFLSVRTAGHNKYTNKAKEMVRLVEGEDSKGSAATRVKFYQAALPAIADRFLLGRGVGSWSTFYYGKDERAYPHNMVTEVLFEEGFLGLAALIYVVFTMYSYLKWLSTQTQSQYSVLGFLILYCFIVAMFSGDLDDNRLIWMWTGLALALCRNLMFEQVVRACRAPRARVVAASRVLTRPSWLHS